MTFGSLFHPIVAMKAPVLLAVLLAVATAGAAPLTLKTRSGQVYKDCEVTKRDATSISVSYADGIATISLEDLTPDLQKELHYTTLAEQKEKADAVEAKEKADKAAQARAALELDQKKRAALAAMSRLSKAEAAKYYGLSEEDIKAQFGFPADVEEVKSAEFGKLKVLIYEREPKPVSFRYKTAFIVWEGDGIVSGGLIKGEAISNPVKHSRSKSDERRGLFGAMQLCTEEFLNKLSGK